MLDVGLHAELTSDKCRDIMNNQITPLLSTYYSSSEGGGGELLRWGLYKEPAQPSPGK